MLDHRENVTPKALGAMVSRVTEKIQSGLNSAYEKAFGLPLERLVREPDTVRKFSASSDPNVRAAVLQFLYDYVSLDESLPSLLGSAATDPSETVRLAALALLGMAWLRNKDGRISNCLATIVLDPTFSNPVRKQAYLSLCPFDGRGNINFRFAFNFPDEVDWDAVKSALSP